AQARRHCEAPRDTPVVLQEVFLEVCTLLDLGLLEVDREGLHLPEEEAGERRASARDARQVAADRVEGERPGGRWRLDDVESFPPPVPSRLDRVPRLDPRERVGYLGDTGVEVGRSVR